LVLADARPPTGQSQAPQRWIDEVLAAC